MKLNEIFDVTADDLGIKYYASSFSGGSRSEDEEDLDFRTAVNVPSHVDIDPQTEVNLVKNARVIKTDTWENIIQWIRGNFDDMTGEYKIAHGEKTLHTFRIT